MLSFSTLALVAITALGPVAQAITVVTPATGDVWLSGTASQSFSWVAVSSDPTSFAVVLSNQNGFLGTSTQQVLIANQSTGTSDNAQSATVTYPSGAWPTGYNFRINLLSSTQSNAAILAQSAQFNISYSATTGTTTSASTGTTSGSIPTTLSTSSSSSATVVTVTSSDTAAAGAASGVIPTTSGKSAASMTFGISTALIGAALGAMGLIQVAL